MSVTPADLLALAGSLAAGDDEARWRGAISRCYYAAFHACGAWHDALPMPGSNAGPAGGVHQELINRLRNPDACVPQAGRDLSKVMAAKLDALRHQRVQADYHLADAMDAVLAANACAHCAEMLNRVAS